MSDILIFIGLILLFCGGVVLTTWGIINIDCDGPSIKNVSLVLIGLIMLALWLLLVKRTSDSNHKLFEETHPIETVTSLPPQVDTTITIKNGVSDTTYTYIFNRQFIMQ